MRFEVVSSVNDCKNKDTIYLILDNWDDWFTYSTLFKVRYIDENGVKHRMSGVKIGQKGQGEVRICQKNLVHSRKIFFHWEYVKIIMIQ